MNPKAYASVLSRFEHLKKNEGSFSLPKPTKSFGGFQEQPVHLQHDDDDDDDGVENTEVIKRESHKKKSRKA
jgi:hypothetical protein